MIDLPSSDPFFLPVAIFAAVLIGLSKGGLPIVAMLSVPILSLFVPPAAAAALTLPIYVVSDVFGIYLYRKHFSPRNLAILLPACLFGIFLGWMTFSVVSDRLVLLIIGLLGVGYCLRSWLARDKVVAPRPADVPRGLILGLMSGYTSFLAHSGGPPYQMYVVPQRLDKLVFTGTTVILFSVMNAAKLPAYWALGQFSSENLTLAIALCPAAFLGAVVAARLLIVISQKTFYRVVEAALFLVSAKLVFDGIAG